MDNAFLNLALIILIILCLAALSGFAAAKLENFLHKKQEEKRNES